jgi:hypothetical protein
MDYRTSQFSILMKTKHSNLRRLCQCVRADTPGHRRLLFQQQQHALKKNYREVERRKKKKDLRAKTYSTFSTLWLKFF